MTPNIVLRPPTGDEWELLRPLLVQHWYKDDLPLKEVIDKVKGRYPLDLP